MKPFPYKALLFDLGGVFIELTGITRMMELTHHRFSTPELWEKWILSPAIRSFESGGMEVDTFGKMVVAEFAINLTPEQYLAEFKKWVAGPLTGAVELLTRCKHYSRIGCLSNTNTLHWERMQSEMNFIHLFDYTFPSHKTGHLKPDSAAYLYAAKAMQLPPEKILFFDDNTINIEGALRAGMAARKVQGVKELKAVLSMYGCT